jgi:predicted transcriptional regulator
MQAVVTKQTVAGMKSSESMIQMTATVVSSYLTRNNVSASDLPVLIQGVYEGLTGTRIPPVPVQPSPITLPSAAEIRRSIAPDWLISFEDGRPHRALKRHLGSRGLTPEQYRTKWGLPESYPMAAPNYSKRRSELAKLAGLGRRGRQTTPATPQVQKTSANSTGGV